MRAVIEDDKWEERLNLYARSATPLSKVENGGEGYGSIYTGN